MFAICLFVCSPKHCSQHECKHDDGQAKGEHEGKEDPVVGGGGVEDDEVDEEDDVLEHVAATVAHLKLLLAVRWQL